MNILFVTSRPSAENGKADQITTLRAKEHLIRDGHNVDELTLVRCSFVRLVFLLIINALQLKFFPLQTLLFASSKNLKNLREALRKKNYDKVYFHLIRTSYFSNIIMKEKRYLGMQLSQELNFTRAAQKLKFGYKKILYLVEAKLCGHYERNVIGDFKCVNVVGTADMQRLLKYGATLTNVTVVPHGIDIPEKVNFERSRDLIFLANFSSEQNRLSLEFLLYKIFPRVRELRPNTTLTIAGRNVPSKFFKRKMNGVRVVGEVAHAHRTISQHKVFINPITASAGMQNKVLTALAALTPVLTTEEAVEGMDLSLFKSVTTCSSDSALLAKTAVKLLNKNRIDKISYNDYEAICEHWSWQNLHKKWSKRFLEID